MKKLLHSEILKERLTAEESLKIERHPITLMIVNVRSLYNVGSIFRTADSARLSELIMCGYTPHPPRKEIDKTALGATESVPWRYLKSASEAITDIKSKGIKVIAVEITDTKRKYDTLTKPDFPMCLVLGNELTGLDDKILKECDDAIEIPMYGVKHSLNVSVAAGIAAYEAVRIWEHSL
ncbi:MAG: RNA methyltransferase [Bacteroidetes bacterium]|nr:RNA methyltransferase [Bacteroidota bacterium]